MGCTSSAPSTLSANASKGDKCIQFEEDSEETYLKHINAIDKKSENRTEMKELPPSDITEPVQLISNNKSTTSLIPEKDLNTSGHIMENESSDANKTTKEYEENDEKISKLKLEIVGKFIGDNTTHDTNNDKDVVHPNIDETTEFTTEDNDIADAKPEIETNSNGEEHENNSEEASPTQSQSSRATRWEALADIAAELPPSLAVDPITGQIYSLSK